MTSSSAREAADDAPRAWAEAAVADVVAARERFAGDCLSERRGRGEPTLMVAPEAVVPLLRFLRDERGYQLLRSVTAVDFHPAEPRFHVVYHITAIPPSVVTGDPSPSPDGPPRLLRVKAPLGGAEPIVDSVVPVYPTADFLEREVFDMFGIDFRGHPDLRRILMPESFEGHPLRKDFPLQYEEVAFSHNEASVHGGKPRAER